MADPSFEKPSARREVLPTQFNLSILIAEDNPVNQKVAIAMVRSFGLSYDLVADGLEAVEKCLSRNYSAVLMDCQMPKVDGFEATRRIRAVRGRALPIIALTAGAACTDRKLAIDAGMDDFLSKPIQRLENGRDARPVVEPARDSGFNRVRSLNGL